VGIFWLLGGGISLLWLAWALGLWRFSSQALRLDRAPADGPEPLPCLSVIVPARNEEAAVEEAMRSLLAADYPELEVIAVDDRSTDRTGAILDRLATEAARLRVVHLRELPPGWLGKTHALFVGSRRAAGEYLLFTDADIHFHRTALRRAVRHAVARGIDHLVILPELLLGGFWETLAVTFFGVMFLVKVRPGRVPDPRSRAYVGVGAFNLVRAEAYRRAGGHAALPMEVVDDVMLGRRMKLSGASQACGLSGGLVRVRWAAGLRGIIAGLEKNAFAGLTFSPASVVSGTAAALVATAWPAIGLFVGPWGARLLCAAALACMMGTAGTASPAARVSPLYGLGFPAAALLFCYAVVRSMVWTYRRGGVVWRGTFYPLAELRQGRRAPVPGPMGRPGSDP
jgi:hypothetical protein